MRVRKKKEKKEIMDGQMNNLIKKNVIYSYISVFFVLTDSPNEHVVIYRFTFYNKKSAVYGVYLE